MKHFIFPIVAILSLQFAACSPESASRTALRPGDRLPEVGERPPAPPNEFVKKPDPRKVVRPEDKWITVDGGNSDLNFNPQVDVLFVIDNSGSMGPTQTKLSEGVARFAESFQKNKIVDYHVGVTTVWDKSEKFINHPDRKYDMGELLPVKDSRGNVTNQRFLTRETGTTQALQKTIFVGLAGRATRTPTPEFEEIFSPITGALRLSVDGAPNQGFFRPNAHLIVILVSDADDTTSGIAPEQLAEELLKFKGNDSTKLSAYGVLVRKSDDDEYKDYDLKRHPKYHKECFDFKNPLKPVLLKNPSEIGCREGFGPENLDRFIVAANPEEGTPDEIKSQHILSLAKGKFGDDLAKFSSKVVSKVLTKEIVLLERPKVDEKQFPIIRVRYGTEEVLAKGGGQVIPAHDSEKGWTFDTENNSIRLSGGVSYQYEPGARFAVDMIPVRTGDID